ncbi:MAG TPA: thioesterase family protein [Candidatus Dormibacteraeota bacterium]
MTDALYVPDAGGFVPSEHTRGPWDPRAQHGGAPAALLGRAIELLPAEVPMQVARVTVDLLRPVPIAPLRIVARVVRPGRRVQLCQAEASAGDDVVCRATAWRIRVADLTVPVAEMAAAMIGTPSTAEPFVPESDQPALHRTGMEIRFSRGAFETPGDATAWFRLRYPVVAGETPSPLQRVLAAADFGNGISSAFEFLTHLYVNTDLTVHLHRLPAGEWVCLDAQTSAEPTGIGLAQSTLYDERGALGRSLQSLLIDALPGRTPYGA